MNRRSPASIGNPAPTGATCAYTGVTGYRTSIRSWPTRTVLRNWLLSLILMRLIREYPLVCAFDKQHCNRAGTVAEEFIERRKRSRSCRGRLSSASFSCPPSDKTNGAGETIKRRDLAVRGVRYPRRLRKSGTRFRRRPGFRRHGSLGHAIRLMSETDFCRRHVPAPTLWVH